MNMFQTVQNQALLTTRYAKVYPIVIIIKRGYSASNFGDARTQETERMTKVVMGMSSAKATGRVTPGR